MLPRLLMFAAGALIIIALFAYNGLDGPEDGLSRAEQEAARNTQDVNLETETEGDETVPVAEATEEAEVEFQTEAAGVASAPDTPELLTVDGYDPQRVRFYLQETDLSVEVREDYLSRLETASGNEDELAAVLEALRAELASG